MKITIISIRPAITDLETNCLPQSWNVTDDRHWAYNSQQNKTCIMIQRFILQQKLSKKCIASWAASVPAQNTHRNHFTDRQCFNGHFTV